MIILSKIKTKKALIYQSKVIYQRKVTLKQEINVGNVYNKEMALNAVVMKNI